MPNVNDLKKSKFLTQKDVVPPVLVTITGYEQVNVAKDGADEELRWTLTFKEHEKPLVLNSTNGNILASIFGDGDFDAWVGKKVVLYNDPTIQFAGKMTGGIRVRAPKQNAKPAPEPEPTAPEDDDIPF
jgi:hypothetical protein